MCLGVRLVDPSITLVDSGITLLLTVQPKIGKRGVCIGSFQHSQGPRASDIRTNQHRKQI